MDQPERQPEIDAVAFDRAVEIVTDTQHVGDRATDEVFGMNDQMPGGQIERRRHQEGRHQRAPLPVQHR